MIWKFLKQNVLFPKGLNWVQHWVSRIGLLWSMWKWWIHYFHIDHNAPCLPPPPPLPKQTNKQTFSISPGYYSLCKRNPRQWLCKIGGAFLFPALPLSEGLWRYSARNTNWGLCGAVTYGRRDRHLYSAWSSEPPKYRAVCRANEIPSSLVISRPWVMARQCPTESNPRPPALQYIALPAELLLPRP